MKRCAPLLRRTRLAPISKRRRRQSDQYRKLRAAFLAAHPDCQVWLAEHGKTEADVKFNPLTGDRFVLEPVWSTTLFRYVEIRVPVPASEEIHHVNKRRGDRLNDTSEWLAVSRRYHREIERNKAWARAKGYLKDF